MAVGRKRTHIWGRQEKIIKNRNTPSTSLDKLLIVYGLVLLAMTPGGVNGLDNAPTVILRVYRYGTNYRHFDVKNGHDQL